MRHPIVRGAAFCLAFALVGARAARFADAGGATASGRGEARPATASELGEGERRTLGLSAVCPPGSLPDGEICLRIPETDESGGEPLVAEPGAHVDKKGRYVLYDQIPRRPDRPADYHAYLYPVPAGVRVGSGYDLDRPDSEQRRGRSLSHVGHGGIDLAAARGSEIRLLRLEHQEGDAEVVFVGKLFGNTVVTRHALREGGTLNEYLLLHGHLEASAPGIAAGQKLQDGALLGFVGDSGSQGIVHLHLEARQVRSGIDLAKIASERLVANEVSIVCDPRNVLPLR